MQARIDADLIDWFGYWQEAQDGEDEWDLTGQTMLMTLTGDYLSQIIILPHTSHHSHHSEHSLPTQVYSSPAHLLCSALPCAPFVTPFASTTSTNSQATHIPSVLSAVSAASSSFLPAHLPSIVCRQIPTSPQFPPSSTSPSPKLPLLAVSEANPGPTPKCSRHLIY